MNLFTPINLKTMALILSVVTIMLYMETRKPTYKGEYVPNKAYPNVSALKHDIFKDATMVLFPMMVYGLSLNDEFYSSTNFLNSIVGKMFVTSIGYAVFYMLVQPYIVNKTPYF